MNDDYIDDIIKSINFSKYESFEQSIYEAFKTLIIQGTIPMGKRINTKKLSRRLNMSRTPLRTALNRLLEEELVEQNDKGWYTKQVTAKDAIEIYDLRKILEIHVMTTAMNLMTEEDFVSLDKLLTQTEQTHESGDKDKVIELFGMYHEFLYQKSNLLRIKQIVYSGREYLKRLRIMALNDYERRSIAIKEHRIMYHIMEQKNKEELKEIVTKHLDDSLKLVLEKNFPNYKV